MADLDLDTFMRGLARRNPGEGEFHQAVRQVVGSLIPFLRDHPQYAGGAILERMTEPDRIIIFRVCWLDDDNNIRTNRPTGCSSTTRSDPTRTGSVFTGA